MFNWFKPKNDDNKDKAKPEPTCYLFIGEQQCIGGFDNVYAAMDAARDDETPDYKVTADMQGEAILFYWRYFVEKEPCGCQWSHNGWHSVQFDSLGSHADVARITFCGDLQAHPPIPVFGSGIGIYSGYMLNTPWMGSARIVSFNNEFPSDGDPLE